jgi:cytoskeletal protein CcmA (bactofilin family)
MISKGEKTPSAAAAPNGPSDGGHSIAVSKASGVPSIISPDLKIIGDLKSTGDVQVDGTVEGDIGSRTLTIGKGGIVQGVIIAETVRIYGSVNGQVNADTVVLANTAKVDGDIAHQSLTMEAGAFVEGHVRRLKAADRAGNAKFSTEWPSKSDTAAKSPYPTALVELSESGQPRQF